MNTSTKYFIMTTYLGFRQWHEDDLNFALSFWGDYKVTTLFDAREKLSEAQVQEQLASGDNTRDRNNQRQNRKGARS